MNQRTITLFIILKLCLCNIHCFSDAGRWDITLTGEKCDFTIPKSLFKGSQIFVMINCDTDGAMNVTVAASLHVAPCSSEYYHSYEITPDCSEHNDSVFYYKKELAERYFEGTVECNHKHSITIVDPGDNNAVESLKKTDDPAKVAMKPLFTIKKDGNYWFSFGLKEKKEQTVTVHLEMKGSHGYLSAAIWPLLPFFGSMCAVYTILCGGWLTVCLLQYRDLLRIQFWIGGVALLGMVDSASYYAVYSSINYSGYFNPEAYMFAEWVCVAKKSLARMLVIIVSLGFGIVKPRLGPALQRVIVTGLLWGLLAAIETWLKLHHKQRDSNTDLLLSQTPLALLDAAICWWVFVSLANTTRALRLRRNTVKLNLYRHFTNTLIFAVVSSVIFMLYSMQMYRFIKCIVNWRDLWLDEGYWHILFACVLTVIMFLWRPTNNNQRYAFTPLLDNADDDDDEEEQFVNDSYGVKMRGASMSSPDMDRTSADKPAATKPEEPATPESLLDEDLRWVEEHIPATALPILDSDEEIINTKFEVSKMQ